MQASHKPERAIAVMKAGMVDFPNLALALELARSLKAGGKPEEAERVLVAAPAPAVMPADQWALWREGAELFATLGRPEKSVEIYRRIFGVEELPRDLRARWLVDARKVALAANEPELAAAWKANLDEIVARMVEEK